MACSHPLRGPGNKESKEHQLHFPPAGKHQHFPFRCRGKAQGSTSKHGWVRSALAPNKTSSFACKLGAAPWLLANYQGGPLCGGDGPCSLLQGRTRGRGAPLPSCRLAHTCTGVRMGRRPSLLAPTCSLPLLYCSREGCCEDPGKEKLML